MCIQYDLNGKKLDYLPSLSEDQFNIKPIYKTFTGWKESTQGIRNFKDLQTMQKNISMLWKILLEQKFQYFYKP